MEPNTLLTENRDIEQPRVNVNITVTIVPFGSLNIRESVQPHDQPELLIGGRLPAEEYVFPETTAVSDILPSPGPTIAITY